MVNLILIFTEKIKAFFHCFQLGNVFLLGISKQIHSFYSFPFYSKSFIPLKTYENHSTFLPDFYNIVMTYVTGGVATCMII